MLLAFPRLAVTIRFPNPSPRRRRRRRTTMPGRSTAEMPYRILGRTGERVSAIGLGGWHLGLANVDDRLSARIIHEAVDRGINFLDNSWDYNDGTSEIRMGR